jgi:integrase
MAEILLKENPADYTFHSFSRTCATFAADSGASPQQIQTLFGLKDASMTMEYISTSKAAVMSIASNLNSVKKRKLR